MLDSISDRHAREYASSAGLDWRVVFAARRGQLAKTSLVVDVCIQSKESPETRHWPQDPVPLASSAKQYNAPRHARCVHTHGPLGPGHHGDAPTEDPLKLQCQVENLPLGPADAAFGTREAGGDKRYAPPTIGLSARWGPSLVHCHTPDRRIDHRLPPRGVLRTPLRHVTNGPLRSLAAVGF